MAKSYEERIEFETKKELENYGITLFEKNQPINQSIQDAFKKYPSKSGGSGINYPDIQLQLETDNMRRIPVMIEVKGTKGKLVKKNKANEIELVTIWQKDGAISKATGQPTHKAGEKNYKTIQEYAVNGAVHYANAILTETDYTEVIAIGVNGYELDNNSTYREFEAYYISNKNNKIPKKIEGFKDLSFLKHNNVDSLVNILDKLVLSEQELEVLARKTEATLEEKIKSIHQSLYDNVQLKTALSTNEKLYLFCGLIMAGLKTPGCHTLEPNELLGNDNEFNNDGTHILNNISSFLQAKNCAKVKVDMVIGLLENVFKKSILWNPKNGECFSQMFRRAFYGHKKVELDLSSWHFEKTDISFACTFNEFAPNAKEVYLNLNGWNTENGLYFGGIFDDFAVNAENIEILGNTTLQRLASARK